MSGSSPLPALLLEKLLGGTARSLGMSMAAAVATRVGLLLLAILIARKFGPEDYGAFTFATGVARLCAQFAVMGWQMLMNRLIPEMLRDKDWSALRGLRDCADWVTAGGSLTAASTLLGLSAVNGEIGIGFILAAILVFPQALAIMRRQQLAAVRLPAAGLLFDQGFGAIIAAVILVIADVSSIERMVVIFALAILTGNAITTWLFRSRLPNEVRQAKRRVEFRPWMAIAFPLLIGMCSQILINRIDVLMLAPLAGLYESGLYGAAFRITFLLSFPQMVIMTVVTPLIGEAFAHGRKGQVRRLQNNALIFAGLTAVPLSLLIIMFPGPVLTFLFGEEFRPATNVLILLVTAQLATALSLPVQSGLTVGGMQKAFGMINLASLGLNVALNFALIPLYGALGAALSAAASATVTAIVGILYNSRNLAIADR